MLFRLICPQYVILKGDWKAHCGNIDVWVFTGEVEKFLSEGAFRVDGLQKVKKNGEHIEGSVVRFSVIGAFDGYHRFCR